ncbi:carbohydrate ABC transporter permease [Clostridium sediminicola]|uniref:carbohydrate ABC transporter permease n=1 Tax=Clostridium sediminicola TaxID=3114879 RepID=UPI0031F1EDA5
MKKINQVDYVNDAISNFAGRYVKVILVFLSVFLVAFPLYWLITSSVKLEQEYLSYPPILIPSKITIHNFIDVFNNNGLGKALYNSLVVSTSTTLISVFIGSMAAYSLARGKLSKIARTIFGVWFMVQKMYPAIATAIPVFLVIRKLGLMDTKSALIIMNTSFSIPLVIWLMMGFFQDLPIELEESAMLDGCNMFNRFFRIVLPITKPGLIAAAILTFVATWNEFLFAVILSIRKAKTLPVVIAGFITDRGLAWGPMAATTVVTIIPVVIIVRALQKDFVKGLSMGAIKG